MAEPRQEVSFLDRPIARVCALGVALLMVAVLGIMHRDDLFPPEAAAPAADDPVARCLAERAADIDGMVEEGTITAAQADLFKSRAEALCQAQAGGGSGPPLPPQ
ncbi:MAG TPA: hypothetical protein EYH07_13135 [Kiloniellaceae bacterium]|nr:hypothetical protein [Kiloniellaceae bacterium]HIP79389.1 hypothetical protein [Kiloniellaceae bacterium]